MSEQQPFWKKEISFGRKPKAAKAPKLPPVPGEEQVPFWKREVSFKRAPKPTTTPVENAVGSPVEESTPIAVPSPAAAPVAPVQPALHEVEAAAAYEYLAAVPDPVEEPWEQAPAVPPAPVAAVPAIPAEAPAPIPAPVEEAPTIEVPAAAVVHPPVPAAELPPLPEEGGSVPFWKKELSFGRKADRAPKSEKTPKKPRAGKETKAEKEPKSEKAPRVKRVRGEGKSSSKGAKKLVGLKIGASQLAAARISNNGVASLEQLVREPLNPGIVVGGELRDPDALAEALKLFFAKHKLPKKGVRLGIANNRIGVRIFDVAGIDDPKQLTNAIRFRAQEALPIPIDEAALDYHVLGESTDAEGQLVRRVLLVVAYREFIDRYVDACRKAGIGLVGIDLEAFALLRALQAPQSGAGDDPSAALVAVAIGHERSTFAVSDGRTCEFTRVLEWGGSELSVAVARVLDATPTEVEAWKRGLSLEHETVPEGLSEQQAEKAREAIRKSVQAFARDLVSSLQFYQNQPGSLGIGEIVLTGGTAHLPGLAAELERLIGVRVRVGDPLGRLKVPKKFADPEQIGSLAVAIGLGIED